MSLLFANNNVVQRCTFYFLSLLDLKNLQIDKDILFLTRERDKWKDYREKREIHKKETREPQEGDKRETRETQERDKRERQERKTRERETRERETRERD